MTAKVFLDTNVLAYAVADDMRKKFIADELLLYRPVSVQVINEFVNVCQRKALFPVGSHYRQPHGSAVVHCATFGGRRY